MVAPPTQIDSEAPAISGLFASAVGLTPRRSLPTMFSAATGGAADPWCWCRCSRDHHGCPSAAPSSFRALMALPGYLYVAWPRKIYALINDQAEVAPAGWANLHGGSAAVLLQEADSPTQVRGHHGGHFSYTGHQEHGCFTWRKLSIHLLEFVMRGDLLLLKDGSQGPLDDDAYACLC